MNNPRVLINVLRNPPSASSLRLSEWDLLIRQARHANMLGRLHAILIEDQACAVPEQAARHLIAGSRLAQRQQTALRWEAAQIRDALSSAGIRAVLLKGAAYVMAGRDAARGRVFADIDILVPQDQLALTEATLMLHGWASAENDA